MTTSNLLSLRNFIGLSDQVYNNLNLQKQANDTLTINGTQYVVILPPVDDSSTSYQGMVLLDRSTNSLVVVNRGTQQPADFVVDAEMAVNDVNAQWSDALNLAQQAANYVAANGITTIYTVGHSLGGTLAQMQAAINGWVGVTFNAYGAGEVLSGLGYDVAPYQPNITNYRTLFDLISEASTQIGNVVTLETSRDSAFLSSGYEPDLLDLVGTIGSDHGISNFYNGQNSDPTGSEPTYVAASMFAFPAPTDVTTYRTQNIVFGKRARSLYCASYA